MDINIDAVFEKSCKFLSFVDKNHEELLIGRRKELKIPRWLSNLPVRIRPVLVSFFFETESHVFKKIG
jgi:hypothetical protein